MTHVELVTMFVDVPVEVAVAVLVGIRAAGHSGVLGVTANHLGHRGSILDHLQVEVIEVRKRVSAQQCQYSGRK